MTACRKNGSDAISGITLKNNPAGVLLEKLQVVKNSPNHHTMIDIWSRVFGCDPSESGRIVTGIAMMMDLADDAVTAVKAYAPGDPEIYLAPIDRIKLFLKTHHLGGQLSAVAGYLDDSTMTALIFTDHVLQLSFSSEHPGATKDAREFIVMLDALLEECLTSELNQELKELFVTNLESLRKALIQYRVGDEAAVQSALDKVTGSIIRNQSSIKEHFEQAQEFVEKTAGFMGRVEEMISKSKNLAALASPVVDVLLPFFR